MKTKEYTLRIKDLLEFDFAVSSQEGDLVCSMLKEMLEITESLVVDFDGIDFATTVFLNAAIGQLYKDYTHEQLAGLKIVNMTESQSLLLNKVIDVALNYYDDPNLFHNSVKKDLNHD